MIQFIRDQSIPVDNYKRRRIRRIIEISDKEEWQYIESAENPADMLTKAPSMEKLDRWFSKKREQVNVMTTILPWRQESEELIKETMLEQIKKEQEQLDVNSIKKKLHIRKDEEGVWQVMLRKAVGGNHKKMLLSNKLPIAEKIARQKHEKLHIGRDALRTEMRKDFYTIGETELAKRIYNSCKRCQEQVRTPKFAYEANDPHPDQIDRKVFKNIGLDHTAALTTKDGKKIYILLIICLYSRNIRAHVVESLEAKDVELALIQMEAKFGEIENIHSDNYASFKNLKKYHPNRKFTAPYASFQAGAWERAIKSVKWILAPYLGRKLSSVEWRTLCVLAESAMNNKPLNKLMDDPEQEIITPSKIAKYHDWEKDTFQVSRRWRSRLARMTRKWHQRMLEEVMRQKREGNKGLKPEQGQKVLIKNEKVKRNLGRKARIEKLIPSHDGKIRNVEIKEQSGRTGRRSLKDLIIID